MFKSDPAEAYVTIKPRMPDRNAYYACILISQGLGSDQKLDEFHTNKLQDEKIAIGFL